MADITAARINNLQSSIALILGNGSGQNGYGLYATVKLNWSSHIKQDYCIYIKQPETKNSPLKIIQCWESSNGNQMIFNFESNEKIEFLLMSSKNKQVIAETAVEVSWVHKPTARKRRWRIF